VSEPNYTISADGKAITCHRCGMVSYHPMDVATRYCGNCHVFHAALQAHDVSSADSLLAEVARLQADNAALIAEIRHRAEIDAEDTHRLQSYCTSLLSELNAARAVVDALRRARSTLQDAWPETRDLRRAMQAYDEAVKVREE
jgi:hypothetical protein